MKYTGTLIGLESGEYGNIYQVITFDRKCYLWKANIVADFNGKMLTIVFNWDGDPYEIKLSLLKENYYTGKVYSYGEEIGTVFLWNYISGNQMLMKGDFEEYEVGIFNCFLELRPYIQK